MRCLIIVALAFMLSLPVAAQDFEKAEEAFERGDYATALRELRRLAEQGYAPAQNKLGDMYYFGFGVLSDNAEVVKWYRRAAEQGHRGGQYNLGGMYYNGIGVSEDYVQAYLWINLAASQGHEGAIQFRDILKKEMTPADVLKAQRLSRAWKKTHGTNYPQCSGRTLPNCSVLRTKSPEERIIIANWLA